MGILFFSLNLKKKNEEGKEGEIFGNIFFAVEKKNGERYLEKENIFSRRKRKTKK